MSPRTFLAVLFVLSGMAGLIHESIWSRYLGLFVGHGRLRSDHRRFLKQTAEGFLVLHDGRFGLCWMNGGHRVEPIPDFPVPAPTVPRLGDLSMSAALRRPPEGILPAEVDPRLPDAVQRKAQMQNVLTRGRAPTDWPAWLFEFAFAERDWHAGVLGVVDEDFYRLVGDFLDRGQAPPEARAAVTFLHDVASWRFPEASREADPLIASAAGGRDWLPPSMLLDASVATKLATGDRAGGTQGVRYPALPNRVGFVGSPHPPPPDAPRSAGFAMIGCRLRLPPIDPLQEIRLL